MPTCRICGAAHGECAAPQSAPSRVTEIREGMDVAGPLEDVDVEIRPGIIARLQHDERDRAQLVPVKRSEPEPKPARKARPVAANKAAGTAPAQ